tara:strand:+ start:2218 stop:2958 length:741 start_codon:yes stop_codon:yes gene_type:complete
MGMKKKFAVCISGYPRFVRKTFDNIKENFLDGLGSYDIYANLQWDKDWKNTQVHHEYNDMFETDELKDFIDLYTPYNLKKIEVHDPLVFDVSNYNKLSLERDMPISLEKSRDIYYRVKSQYQGISDCVNMAKNTNDYEYFIRMRTDLVFHTKLDLKNLHSSVVLNQNGYVAGADRHCSDWFFITPTSQLQFYDDLAKVEEHFRDGILHVHRLIENIGRPYGMKYYEFSVGTPSTTQACEQLFKSKK